MNIKKKIIEKALEMTQQCIEYEARLKKSTSKRLKKELTKREMRIIRKINISRESAEHNKKRI